MTLPHLESDRTATDLAAASEQPGARYLEDEVDSEDDRDGSARLGRALERITQQHGIALAAELIADGGIGLDLTE